MAEKEVTTKELGEFLKGIKERGESLGEYDRLLGEIKTGTESLLERAQSIMEKEKGTAQGLDSLLGVLEEAFDYHKSLSPFITEAERLAAFYADVNED